MTVSGVVQGIRAGIQSIPTSKFPLFLSAANQPFQETVYKGNYWPMNYLQGFFLCVDGLKMPNCVVISPYRLTVGQCCFAKSASLLWVMLIS